MTAIQVAAERGVDAGLMAALLDGGADPYLETREGLDSFLLALVCGKMDNLTVLLEKALANLLHDHWLTNRLRKSGMSGAPCGQATFDAYLSAIADADLTHTWDENGHSLLFLAIGRENKLLAEELIKLGADPNLADPLDWTPFHEAVRIENVPLAKFLMDPGADIFKIVSTVSPCLTSSSLNDSYIAYNGPLVPAMNSPHIAIGVPHDMDMQARARLSPDIVRFLLDLGLDPNAKIRDTGGLPFWELREEKTPCKSCSAAGGVSDRGLSSKSFRCWLTVAQTLLEVPSG
ncbi:ankyrin repeat-containing domain protein [Thelonectria olida]|uniref:NF-kappa-B inhibitor alpha n=1 Tax=Thelonectria olida TaxID=1576542 RepID=A0A9P9AFI9_9HYPO|nr:ankyrin repeat-containing domain protein [Thelonectria olida]